MSAAVPDLNPGPWFVCSETIRWLQAVADMAERSEQMHSRADLLERVVMAEGIDFQERATLQKELFLWHNRAFSTDHFFLEAARNSERWANLLGRSDAEVSKEIDEFCKALGPLKAIRDMREHADAYLQGKGRRDDFAVDYSADDGLLIRMDATSAERRDNDVIYGGRVSREDVRSTCAGLKAVLDVRLDRYADL